MILTALSPSSFSNFISSHEVAIVDFWAEWCGPCQIMGPVLEALAEEFNGLVGFGAVNVDQQPSLSESAAVMNIPTLIIYDNGIEAGRLVGIRSKDSLRKIITDYLPDF